ncbi:MAG: universal stress protein [Actinobacteria bacterium]|nr:universal stress protein [Actinomycetota bacterium]
MSDISVIVLCLDGSDESVTAARVALELTEPGSYRFTLATAVPDIESAYVTGIDPIVPMAPDAQLVEVVEQRRERAAEMLEAAAAQLGLPEANREVLFGLAGPALREYAREHQPALLVTGARGFNDTRRSGVGEVPDYLVRRAPCPVLVVPADIQADRNGPVLVCVDGSEHARHAALTVVPLLAAGADVELVTVAAEAPVVVPDETGYEILSERKWEAEEDVLLDEVATAIARPDASHTVLSGPPAETLLSAATRSSSRAMVIGSKGHGLIARAVLGSVAHKILSEATCPVFVAGPRT